MQLEQIAKRTPHTKRTPSRCAVCGDTPKSSAHHHPYRGWGVCVRGVVGMARDKERNDMNFTGVRLAWLAVAMLLALSRRRHWRVRKCAV